MRQVTGPVQRKEHRQKGEHSSSGLCAPSSKLTRRQSRITTPESGGAPIIIRSDDIFIVSDTLDCGSTAITENPNLSALGSVILLLAESNVKPMCL